MKKIILNIILNNTIIHIEYFLFIKIEQNGEDAFFLNENFLAITDGIGGWIDHDIDPGIYAKQLCLKFYLKNLV